MPNKTIKAFDITEKRGFIDVERLPAARSQRISKFTFADLDLSLLPAPLIVHKPSCGDPARKTVPARNCTAHFMVEIEQPICDRQFSPAADNAPQSERPYHEGNRMFSASALADEYISTCVQQPDDWSTPDTHGVSDELPIFENARKELSMHSSVYSTDMQHVETKPGKAFVYERLQWYRAFFHEKPLMRCLDTLGDEDPGDRLFDRLLEDIKGGPSSRGVIRVCAFWDDVRSQLRDDDDVDDIGEAEENTERIKQSDQRKQYDLRLLAGQRPGQRLWSMSNNKILKGG